MTGGADGGTARIPGFAAGCWGWIGFAIAAVAVRGVYWDETLEHAQVLTGAVPYPDGHPLKIYVQQAFSVQTWLSAALLWSSGSALLVCFVRNTLFLLASVLPAYLFAARMTGSAAWGHAAALFLLQGVLLDFSGSYPMAAWPALYSNGPIGGGMALLALYALAAGHWRLGGLLFGLTPAVHAGQFPVLLGAGAAAAGWALWRGAPAVPRAAWHWLAIGCAITGAALLLQRGLSAPLPGVGPYAAHDGAEAIWRHFTAAHDPHRRPPDGNGHLLLGGTIALALLLAATKRGAPANAPADRMLAWAGLYAGGIAVAVWGTRMLEIAAGGALPFLLTAWMPYRMINHLPPLFLAFALCAITRGKSHAPWAALALLGLAAIRPLLAPWLPPDLFQRYLSGGEFVPFALLGLAFTAAAPRNFTGGGIAALLAAAAAFHHRFGAVCMLAGIVLGTAAGRFRAVPPVRTLYAVLLIAAALLLWEQGRHREHLPKGEFEIATAALLAGQPAMLAAPPESHTLQMRTGLPVLIDAATPSLISYVPALGPAIDRMHRDLYGSGFGPDPPASPSWRAHWTAMDAAAWRALAARYGVTHVAAPAKLELPLPTLLESGGWRLHDARPAH